MPFIGEFFQYIFDYEPTMSPQTYEVKECNGQLLPIVSYPALYKVIGTTYGGDGITTFGLPDLRFRSVRSGNPIDIPNLGYYYGRPYIKYYICVRGGDVPLNP